MSDYFETVIIGAGQAGLSTAYHLTQQDRSFVMLEAKIGRASCRERVFAVV